MIYDKPITVLAMPDTQGIPTKGGLVKKFDSWCAEKTVYASRFWESVANGSRVDKLVELPLHRDVPAAGYARLGGHTYRVEQTQTGEDGDDRTQTAISKVQLDILTAKFPDPIIDAVTDLLYELELPYSDQGSSYDPDYGCFRTILQTEVA